MLSWDDGLLVGFFEGILLSNFFVVMAVSNLVVGFTVMGMV